MITFLACYKNVQYRGAMLHATRQQYALLFGVLLLLGSFYAPYLAAQKPDEYSGTIGKNLAVRLSLTQHGEQITGQYFYEKVGEPIALQGSINAGGELTLEEFAEKGVKTGIFKGKLAANGTFTGTWAKPNSTKTLPCSFKRVSVPAKWDGISGSYKRFGKDVAFIDVEVQSDGLVKMQGQAFWYGDPKTGNVHTGEVGGYIRRTSSSGGVSTLIYSTKPEDFPCGFTMTINGTTLTVTDEKGTCGGANVYFMGTYKRVGNPPKKWDVLLSISQ